MEYKSSSVNIGTDGRVFYMHYFEEPNGRPHIEVSRYAYSG